MLASTLHLLFEFLAFKSDINFWQENKSLAGLSVRAVITDLFSQIIVFLFLVDSNTSLLVIIPSFCAIVIQCWKVQKATGLTMRGWQVVMLRLEDPENYGKKKVRKSRKEKEREKELKRLKEEQEQQEEEEEEERGEDQGKADTKAAGTSTQEDKKTAGSDSKSTGDVAMVTTDSEAYTSDELARVTLEADRLATSHIGAVLFPLVIGFALRTLIMDKHGSWYSWLITTLTGCV
jgi:hypothetical protein